MTEKPKPQYFVEFPDGRRVSAEDLPAFAAARQAQIINERMISLEEAVERCGITVAQFKALIKEKVFPDRVRGSHLWDRKALYKRLDELKIQTDMIEPGWVYFMEMGSFIKIGWASWPAQRRDTLQIGNPYDIKILGGFPGTKANEAGLHVLFAHAHHRGEWFKRSPGLLAYVAWLKIAWRGDSRMIRGDLDNVVKLGGDT